MSTPHAPRRSERLQALAGDRFDLAVIGGGITGAGVARDAARRGLRVALLEAEDFAAGTSSRSSRLVHGGVRYLEHGYLHLVWESSRERRRLLQQAPHLVRPLQFTWPVYRGARVKRWQLAAALTMYDALAMFRNVGRHRRLDTSGVLSAEPLLARDGLLGGATYWDAATDDSRLTLANVLDAAAHGAVVLNHAPVRRLTFNGEHGPADGVEVHDALGGATIHVRAKLVVSCVGPWTDEIARLEDPHAGPAVRGTKGVHIAVPASRVGNVAAVTMLSPDDGRVMFTLPASGGMTIVGTTDTPTTEHPADVRAARADVRYLLNAANRFFPEARLTEDDVVSAWAGIRPLVASGNTGDPSSASREHATQLSRRGVLTATGGKLTTYRAQAQQIVDAAVQRLGVTTKACDTADAPLPGARPAATGGDVRIVPELTWRESDVDQAVRQEFAESLADVMIRRTFLAFELPDQGRSIAPRIARRMAPRLGWTDAGIANAVREYTQALDRIFTITP
ncbi:glycerol-3-phosphate dehydrogenase/oxidase [Pseudogemmatithrix spongiicola]|uniref:Glycerol-3-phosphate dehydrogenase n=1 Tax=Pseudogemmatithrix spongiicola TaxID=3062599 RepID=A0AA49K209_9BACT|nr:glycerol-3-phosphate dehydrogenase/oxidase [Gemmatimonadaceae bacterium 'strain 138']WKW16269.1 glycerol-3-phosphate dehydrogenase/oxidase [Gemmatimonadaceae bacterium 'strain 318']